jgi:DNA polymerase elongation subunit (family B)
MKESFILQDEFANLITTGREIVAARGIFVDKKRYILHIINDDGDTVDKLKVMGLDTKKTTLPKAVSTKLNKFIERYLKGEEWDVIAREVVDYKSELTNSNDIRDLGLPKAVKNVEAYTREHQRNSKCRLPGHVAASIFYNINLDKYGDTQSVAIASGNNIKVFYLRTPVGRFKSIALPVDMDEEPVWFKDFVVDKGAAITRLVDNPLQNIIKAINKRVPTEHSLFADSIIEF